MTDVNKSVVVAYMFSLKEVENSQLAALNLAAALYGKCPPQNVGFDVGKEIGLFDEASVDEKGALRFREESVEALFQEVNRRVADGTFV